MSEAPELSVIVPVYRSATTLRELVARLDRALEGERAELLFAVDASPDESLALLRALRRERRERRVCAALRVLVAARNGGQHAALRAGFRRARGRALIVLDADLQYPPEDLPRLVAAWRAGAELVAGYRTERRDAYVARVLPSALFNAFARGWSGVALRDFGCGFCLLDAQLVPRIERAGARRRFLKPLLGALASRRAEIPVGSAARATPSSYGALRLAKLAAEFAVGWSARPFVGVLILGLLALSLGLAAPEEWLAQRALLVALGALVAAAAAMLLAWHRTLQREVDDDAAWSEEGDR